MPSASLNSVTSYSDSSIIYIHFKHTSFFHHPHSFQAYIILPSSALISSVHHSSIIRTHFKSTSFFHHPHTHFKRSSTKRNHKCCDESCLSVLLLETSVSTKHYVLFIELERKQKEVRLKQKQKNRVGEKIHQRKR